MTEQRLIDIETRIAHQDQALQELNEVITDQQARIMRLESLSESLIEKLQSLADASGEGDGSFEIPPHY